MSDLTHSESIFVEASPDAVYELVSDVTRTGEWSTECVQCWWDEGSSGEVGDGFTGRNVSGEHTWEAHCTVSSAERGRQFGFSVGDDFVHWSYSMQAQDGGTRLTEAWEFRPNGIELFHKMYGDDAATHIAARIDVTHQGISHTLRAMKRIAEGG